MSIELKNGTIQSMTVHGHTYSFRTDEQYAGPSFHIVYAGQERVSAGHGPDANGWHHAYFWGVHLYQRAEATEDGLRIQVRMKNNSTQAFRPDRISLELGVDTYMDSYPEWNDKVFPTLIRCEKTHLWGYLRAPGGRILGVASPDPAAGWGLEYNHFFCDSGHRIYTARLDLISGEKQPARHPVIDRLLPGEEKRWTVELFDAPSVDEALRTCSRVCQAPVFAAEKLIVEPGEAAEIRIYCPEKPELGGPEAIACGEGEWKVLLPGERQAGHRALIARAMSHESEAILYRRKNWSFYLDAARQAAIDMPQKTGSHCESWYGLFSGFQAAKYLPDPDKDAQILAQFENLLPLAFDADKGEPTYIRHRIQNTAVAVSLCEDAYQATGDIKWLETGAKLADFLADRCQDEEGVFRSGKTHYTCVVYIAKSILELYLCEREQPGEIWQARADKHFAAARRAIDELVRNRDNIGTEGEHTFEDGMISCSVTQMSMMALLLPEEERAPYIEAAEALLEKHRCLERLGSADARSRNTTVRFWEAQYDVLIPANMINSPHGWTGWKIYGVWYLYLLTGKAEYLEDAMETLGSCAQLIDLDGTLRWAFIPDPCISSGLWKPDGNGQGYLQRCTFGETYVDMISEWYRAPENTPIFGYLGDYDGFESDQGGCCDNDVHECFKALAEVALPYGYIYHRGGLRCFNGALTAGDVIEFTPAEAVVQAVHVNLPEERDVLIHFAGGDVKARLKYGWVSSAR